MRNRAERLQQFIRERLRQEIEAGPRGTAAQIAKAAGISAPHITNMLDSVRPRGPGLDVIEKLARYWGTSMSELEAISSGSIVDAADVEWENLSRALLSARYDHHDVKSVCALYEGQGDVSPLTWARRLDDARRRREQGLDEEEAERARMERIRRADTPLDEVLRARPDLQSAAARYDPHGPRPANGWLEFLLEEARRERAGKRRR